MLHEISGTNKREFNKRNHSSKPLSNVMALLVDLRETGEKSASAKINSRSLRTQSAASE